MSTGFSALCLLFQVQRDIKKTFNILNEKKLPIYEN